MARSQPPKGDRAYRQLWRVVDGAVADAFAMHPNYLTPAGERAARLSVVKRVTGAVHGFAVASAARGVSEGHSSGAVIRPAVRTSGEVGVSPPAWRTLATGVRRLFSRSVTSSPEAQRGA